jgi:hypothetical protein
MILISINVVFNNLDLGQNGIGFLPELLKVSDFANFLLVKLIFDNLGDNVFTILYDFFNCHVNFYLFEPFGLLIYFLNHFKFLLDLQIF